jgi:uncharacterized membrane protein YqgA involved in biofilm formation
MLAATPAKGKLFFVSFTVHPRHNLSVTGAFLNALGILLGGLLGLMQQKLFGLRTQLFFRSALGAFIVLFGLQLVWENLGGNLVTGLKQLFIVALAVVIGFWTGRLLRLQTLSNRLGRYASSLIATAQKNPPGRPGDGFLAGSILFSAAPLGILGAVADGLGGYVQLLAVKGVMDALAAAAFVKLFNWPAALAAAPVFLILTGITAACHSLGEGVLATPAGAHPVMVAVGFVTCSLPLVIFEVRRVELANFLPALAVAPVLAKFLGW